ncbi:glycosyltransferase family 4 protein [Gluconacetobacter diazotrophicus]|uniref:Glycosyltransferase family 4 protein n=1 Tax=Gluconacetobacter diazotrophicus TaxID=33996 RepID=A0A7W4FDE7_GLUDI|nr:glycosyltransferase family 1 protein [Gluconacetobacter diazotrophicus]MBB2155721.1 glycosyltransferase family 4 protein [Gluconacetobacter diazotrophicus]
MQSALYVNSRFLTQPLSGVQRFATEITSAIGRVWSANDVSRPILLTPAAALIADGPGDLERQFVGRRQGQIWEQIDLPRRARDGVLLNLGNTAPIMGRRQLVVLHDAGIFSQPDAYSWRFRLWYRVLHNLLLRTRSRLVTVSEFSRGELARHLGVVAERFAVIPEGADHISRLAADHAVLARHGLATERYVLVVGNLAPHKNLASLGVLARMLAARDIALVITGALNRSVFNGQDGITLPAPAHYIGRVSDTELCALYQNAACFVFPSRYEGFGLPAVEAMACGCPVVASSIPALREVCADAALYAHPDDPVAIASTVARVIDTPGLAQDMRMKGMARAAGFTWDKAARALLDLVHDREAA